MEERSFMEFCFAPRQPNEPHHSQGEDGLQPDVITYTVLIGAVEMKTVLLFAQ
jgi:hypothetical protein